MLAKLNPIRLDVLLAVVLTWLTLATTVSHTGGHIGWVAYVLAALTVAPIALRQVAPVATMIVMMGALAGYSLLEFDGLPSAGLGALVGMFTVATLRSRLVAVLVFLVAASVVVVAYLRLSGMIAWSEVVQSIVVVIGAWVLGEGTKRWAERAERLAEDAARAVAEERVRIARELHDIVAHHMSVISLQAGLAQYVLDTDLPTARKAITTVGDTSREALTEMRRLLDVLRVDQDDDYRPQPGLAALDDLVERARGAGLPVEVVITGDVRELQPGPDLCAYRVAQESLTNVLKHAGPAKARIDVDYGEQTLMVKVTDNGGVPDRGISDAGVSDGGVPDGGHSDGRATTGARTSGAGNGGIGNSGSGDSGSGDSGAAHGWVANDGAAAGRAMDSGAAAYKVANNKAVNRAAVNRGAVNRGAGGRVVNRAAAEYPSHGIRGMRERAELYGGVLTAGPLPGGGFGVVLRLPMAEVAAR
ncbi:sensor histidine kinase [Saccharothrix sp. NRRL B-16314]|uniref:sensor histidine kinase n=1 Tax=Saccharothrix sp. NRRL B-16314 TaxID=1463825 RepID=UPI0022AEA456|nr:histidine kinase [Saccharothrix sp. NRRL B-16314]